MKKNQKRAVQAAVLAAALGLMGFGWFRGEAQVVLGKAITICLQCIGVG